MVERLHLLTFALDASNVSFCLFDLVNPHRRKSIPRTLPVIRILPTLKCHKINAAALQSHCTKRPLSEDSSLSSRLPRKCLFALAAFLVSTKFRVRFRVAMLYKSYKNSTLREYDASGPVFSCTKTQKRSQSSQLPRAQSRNWKIRSEVKYKLLCYYSSAWYAPPGPNRPDSMLSLVRIALLICTGAVLGTAETWEEVGRSAFPSDSFLNVMVHEGLSNNGSHYIINSVNQIFLTTLDFEIVLSNRDAIPHELRKTYQYNHIGDTQFTNGKLFGAVEEPTYTQPAIFVYNVSETAIDFWKYAVMPQQRHAPWVAQHGSLLYSSEYNAVTELHTYDAQSLEYQGPISLSMTLDEVQGGAFYRNALYLGVNHHNAVYKVDTISGEVSLVMEQTDDETEYEFEGLTFMDLSERGYGIMHNTGNHQNHPKYVVHADIVL